jgi:hypothetical protein
MTTPPVAPAIAIDTATPSTQTVVPCVLPSDPPHQVRERSTSPRRRVLRNRTPQERATAFAENILIQVLYQAASEEQPPLPAALLLRELARMCHQPFPYLENLGILPTTIQPQQLDPPDSEL